jgi:hypothetical protein
VNFAPFGLGTVSRALQPQISEFLYDLSASDGADFTRGGDEARNGEPDGELGLVRQQDPAWQDQTGAPDDPQPGNIPGGPRDVLRSASFDGSQGIQGTGFFADSGVFEASGGELRVAAESQGGDAVAVYHVGDQLPIYFELVASVKFDKGTGGWDGNAYMIFDYQHEYDFKFVGIDDKVNKLVMGHRDSNGWHVDTSGVVQGGVKPDKWYNMLIAVNGLNVTLVVNNKEVFQHTYAARIDEYGNVYALNWGMVGMGSNNAQGSFDNIQVRILPPQVTLDESENFDDLDAQFFSGDRQGVWEFNEDLTPEEQLPPGETDFNYDVSSTGDLVYNMIDLGPDNLNFNSYLELNVDVNAEGMAGLIFDRYGDESFKFAAVDVVSQQLIIGHYTQKAGWVVDEAMSTTITASADYTLGLTLKGTTANVTLNDAGNGGYQAIASYVFNASTVDGNFGLFSSNGAASFDNLRIKTDDRAFDEQLVAEGGEVIGSDAAALTAEELAPIVGSAIEYWRAAGYDVSIIEGMTVEIVDLPGALLGLVEDDTVYIDINAAGHGWFVDPTPFDAEEYAPDGDGTLSAIAGGDADGRIDLMTVVTHELGHALGIVHDDSELMDESLAAGVREVSSDIAESAATEVVESLDHYNILVTSAVDWSGTSVGNSPQANLPDSMDSNNASGPVSAQTQETLVFDEVSGEFIEIENAVAENMTTTAPNSDESADGGQNDWIVVTDPAEGGTSLLDTSGDGTGATAIDWNAGGEEVNDLLPSPLPGRSGMKHSNGKGASGN